MERGECDSKSHPTRGAWIEISTFPPKWSWSLRRTPHGVRGLKYSCYGHDGHHIESHPTRGAWIEIWAMQPQKPTYTSHPTRGAWIEIFRIMSWLVTTPSRTPHGVRGLKLLEDTLYPRHSGRTPHGVRGLKFCDGEFKRVAVMSHPTRGAWIENC